MAVPRTVFRDRLSISNELYRLVQDQLSEAPRTNTLNDLKTTIETLSTFTGACESVLTDISSRGQETDLRTAVEGIRNVLTWAKFLDTIRTTPSDPNFLFRAHKHAATSQPTFVPDLDVPFDLGFRRTHSIDKFVEDLAEHLGKTRKAKSETYFVSMSPILEWTIHTAGQKWIHRGQDEVGLAIFDVKKLQQNSGTIIFRVSDVLKFLAGEGKDSLIEQGLQQWARNCDEYVSVGKISDDGLVRWVAWDKLYLSPANILSKRCFVRARTLGVYRKWIQEYQQPIELEDICQRMVEFGKVLAGPQEDLLSPLIELLLKPGILFWGFINESSEEVVIASIRALVDETGLESLSGLTI
ncbi:hypothetical protein VE01_07775 [Pseudogymnoascus verrucosus]|uniref:DUF7587 domain-containing protein n=1 Tax=Pseudogymnoascus verrucosus TaxID=342668 RepID=A0A1B8GEZ1_9PEZI|nr:uncharacterized protein VE01_07775 [Pseudogymnoascus verrucosus]OBT94396.1 hypothetical protein VE01_07775 [Pseudogymnoascus verrucosus]